MQFALLRLKSTLNLKPSRIWLQTENWQRRDQQPAPFWLHSVRRWTGRTRSAEQGRTDEGHCNFPKAWNQGRRRGGTDQRGSQGRSCCCWNQTRGAAHLQSADAQRWEFMIFLLFSILFFKKMFDFELISSHRILGLNNFRFLFKNWNWLNALSSSLQFTLFSLKARKLDFTSCLYSFLSPSFLQ